MKNTRIVLTSLITIAAYASLPAWAAASVTVDTDCSAQIANPVEYLKCLTSKAEALYKSIFSATYNSIAINLTQNDLAKAEAFKTKYENNMANKTAVSALYDAILACGKAQNALDAFLRTGGTGVLDSVTTAANDAYAKFDGLVEIGNDSDFNTLVNKTKENIGKIKVAVEKITIARSAYDYADKELQSAEAARDLLILQNALLVARGKVSAAALHPNGKIPMAVSAVNDTGLSGSAMDGLSSGLINRLVVLDRRAAEMHNLTLADADAMQLARSVEKCANVGDALDTARRVGLKLVESGGGDGANAISDAVDSIMSQWQSVAEIIGNDGTNLNDDFSINVEIPEDLDKNGAAYIALTGLQRKAPAINEFLNQIRGVLVGIQNLQNLLIETQTWLDRSALSMDVTNPEFAQKPAQLRTANDKAGILVQQLKNYGLQNVGLEIDTNRIESSYDGLQSQVVTVMERFTTLQLASRILLADAARDAEIYQMITDITRLTNELKRYAVDLDAADSSANAELQMRSVEATNNSILSKFEEITNKIGADNMSLGRGPAAAVQKKMAAEFFKFAEDARDAIGKIEALNNVVNNASGSNVDAIKSAYDNAKTAASTLNDSWQVVKIYIPTSRVLEAINRLMSQVSASTVPAVKVAMTDWSKVSFKDKINRIMGIVNPGASFTKEWDEKWFSSAACGQLCDFKDYARMTFCGSCSADPNGPKNTNCTDGQTSFEMKGIVHDYSGYRCMMKFQ